MCGICGKFSLKENISVDLIEKMCWALAHRGPDDQGLYVHMPIGMGNRRLSILDLSPAGHQPMSDENDRFIIVYNGEVYNYREIRTTLVEKGYSFKSNSDTEVVLKSYVEWGADCLEYFNGMFGIAIWDQAEQRLFLARDRMGIKPLYYYFDGAKLVFASEIKSILQDSSIPRELSQEGMVNYFTFGHSVAPRTILKNIYKLLPGYYIVGSINENKNIEIRIKQYWATPTPENTNADEQYYISRIQELLKKSVERRLIADVPLGVFLSGGLDSSIITSLMASVSTSRIKTFTIGFSNSSKSYSELDDARVVAQYFDTDHHEILLGENDLTEVLPDLIYHYDEPFGDAANFPTYLLSKFARKHVTVCLSGEGSDELFGGYRRYVIENWIQHYFPFTGLLDRSPIKNVVQNSKIPEKLRRLAESLTISDISERYANWLSVFKKEMRIKLLADYCKQDDFDPIGLYRKYFTHPKLYGINRMLYIDQQTWLPDTYLEKADKASMAVGLEVRVPFLDHELVEFAAKIPSKYKISGVSTKRILKSTFLNSLPAQTLQKRKHGFTPPFDPWFRGKLNTFIKEVVLDSRARSRGLFNYDYIEDIFVRHTQHKGTFHWHLWLLTVFELWCQRFLDNNKKEIF